MSGPTVALPGSLSHAHKARVCSKCGAEKDPAGGIQMSPQKWICNACWKQFNSRKK